MNTTPELSALPPVEPLYLDVAALGIGVVLGGEGPAATQALVRAAMWKTVGQVGGREILSAFDNFAGDEGPTS